MKCQFSLRRLFLATALAAAGLGIIRWYCVTYCDQLCPVPDKASLARLDPLAQYAGRRVSLRGKYQYIGSNSDYQVLWFAGQPIAIFDERETGGFWSRAADGAVIAVTGRLTRVQTPGAYLAPVAQRVWQDEGAVCFESTEQPIIYSISVESRGDTQINGTGVKR